MLSSEVVQNVGLGLARKLTVLKGVHGHNQLEGRDARRKLDQLGDVRKRANHGGQLGVVDDVLGGIGAEGLVKGNGIK